MKKQLAKMSDAQEKCIYLRWISKQFKEGTLALDT